MYCEKCGNVISEEELFCEMCGTPIQKGDKALDNSSPMIQRNNQVPPMIQRNNQVPPMNQRSGQVPPYGNQQMHVAPKKPMNKIKKITLIEAIICAICFVVVFNIVNEKMGPEEIAEQYFNAMLSGNYSTMYNMMEVPEGDLLSEEIYVSVNSRDYVGKIDVDTVEITSMTEDDKSDTYVYECMYEEDDAIQYEYITVQKQENKKWFLFDDWKIDSSSEIQGTFTIETLPEVTVMLEGIDLSTIGGGVVSIEETTTSKIYNMEAMFDGIYNVVVVYDDMELYNNVEYLGSGGYKYIADVPVSEELKTDLASNTMTFLEQMLQSTLDEEAVEVFDSKISIPAIDGFTASGVYGVYGWSSSNRVIEKVELSSFQFYTDNIAYDTEYQTLILWQRFGAEFIQEGYNISGNSTTEYNQDSYMEGYMGYIYTNGEWQLATVVF